MNRYLPYLYLMELCAGFARGSYLVCIGWTTLIVVGNVAAVGQVFIVAMLTSVLVGPVAAVIIDRYNRKHLTIFAHLGIAVALLFLGLAVSFDSGLSIFWFFLTVVLVTVCRMIYQGSHDGLIRGNANVKQIAHTVARFRGIHLLATAVGTILSGVIIEYQSATAGFVLSGFSSLLLVIAVAFVKGVTTKENIAGFTGFLADFSGGLALFRDNQLLKH